jgi:hypothetical protein
MYSEITCDLLCIAKRLKNINPVYRVFFNNRETRYEVHTCALRERPSAFTIGFVIPFETLDERTLDYAFLTRKENFDALQREIETSDSDIKASAQKSLAAANTALRDMLEYANKANHTVIFTKNLIKEF